MEGGGQKCSDVYPCKREAVDDLTHKGEDGTETDWKMLALKLE